MIYKCGVDFGIDLYRTCCGAVLTEDAVYDGDFIANYKHDDETIYTKNQKELFKLMGVWNEKMCKAVHPLFGKIVADLDEQIEVESVEAYDHFFTHHPTEIINFHDC